MISNRPLPGAGDSAALPLAGQLALVTGGARRLGRTIATELCAAGADLLIHYNRSHSEAEQLATAIRQSGRLAWTISTDLQEQSATERLIADATTLTGRPLDILLNNASIYAESDVSSVTMVGIEQQVRINASAPLLLARAFAAQKRPSGCIINMLDARMVDYDSQHLAYHLSKRMLLSITQLLALELAPTIRVNGVAPGVILPDEGQPEASLEAMVRSTPLGRHGEPSDVARAVRFLAENNFITGQILYVDGGRHLRGRVYGE